jgi:hypothetical protein
MTTAIGIDAPRCDGRDNARFLDDLRSIVGRRYVLTSLESTRRYRKGFRFGTGPRWPLFDQATSSSSGEC